MPKKRPSGTLFSNVRYKYAIYFSVVNFACLITSFVTPYWLQSWPRIHTPIKRLGLWEFCLNGYIARLDPNMVSHFDCWWIFAPYLSDIFTTLSPWWFILIQVLMSISIFFQGLLHFCLIFYWCYQITNIERRLRFIKLGAVCHGATFFCLLPTIITFGAKHKDPDWMPYPTLNWASWSYGLAILSTFFSLFEMLAFEFTWRECKRTLVSEGYDFPMSTVLRKGEKAAFVAAQEKAAVATNMEPVTSKSEVAELKSADTSVLSYRQHGSTISTTMRAGKDPRLVGVTYRPNRATYSTLSGEL